MCGVLGVLHVYKCRCITCVADTCVIHMFYTCNTGGYAPALHIYLYTCNTYIGHTPLYMYFYTCYTGVGYTPVLDV